MHKNFNFLSIFQLRISPVFSALVSVMFLDTSLMTVKHALKSTWFLIIEYGLFHFDSIFMAMAFSSALNWSKKINLL